MKKLITVGIVFLALSISSFAQKVSISTNLIDWADLVTYNGEFGIAVSRHISIAGGVRWNDRQIDKSSHIVLQNKQKTFSLGAKYWPWYVNSGAWVYAKGQYQEYSRSGIWRLALEQGKVAGLALGGGYSLMLTKHINIEFGAGLFAGYNMDYKLFNCPVCMDLREEGKKFYFGPDDLFISIAFIL